MPPYETKGCSLDVIVKGVVRDTLINSYPLLQTERIFWGNKAQSQLLIPWDSKHIPAEAFHLSSASGQLTADILHTHMHLHEHICTYMSTTSLKL